MVKYAYLVFGGVLGTVARYWLAGLVCQKLGPSFPFGTLIVNVTGCFLVGILSTITNERLFLGPESKVLLIAGFCGAYTTFSAYILETSQLMMNGEMLRAFFNIILSTMLGFVALRLGILLGESI